MLTIEKDIESYLIKRVEEYGGMCLKFPTIHTEGIPDRLVLLPVGRVVFVELKRPKGGKLSEIQKYQIAKLKKIGMQVEVLKTKAEVDAFLRKVDLPNGCPRDESDCVFFDDNMGCMLPSDMTCSKYLRWEINETNND